MVLGHNAFKEQNQAVVLCVVILMLSAQMEVKVKACRIKDDISEIFIPTGGVNHLC